MALEDHGCIAFEFVLVCVVGKKPVDPKVSPMADTAITQGGIGGLGSLVYLVYICGPNTQLITFSHSLISDKNVYLC